MRVTPIAEARAAFSRTLSTFRNDPNAEPVAVGSHRRPEAIMMPFGQYQRLVTTQDSYVTLERLKVLKPVIERLAEVSNLRDVAVFGSVARGQQTSNSDLDLLVTPEAGATLFDIARFELDMEILLGVPVTVISIDALDEVEDAVLLRDKVSL